MNPNKTDQDSKADKESENNAGDDFVKIPTEKDQRFATVAIVGAPNSGKSTLLNYLASKKISIVSPKAQTTRENMLYVLVNEEAQLAFLDTPGIAQQRNLNKKLTIEVADASARADIFIIILDANLHENIFSKQLRSVLHIIEENNDKAILALNKVDLCKKQKLLHMTTSLIEELSPAHSMHYISAKTGDGLTGLLKSISDLAPIGKWQYSKPVKQEINKRLAEALKESIFYKLDADIPYRLTTRVDEVIKRNNRTFVRLSIITENPRHKKIVIGKEGSKIAEIRRHFIPQAVDILNSNCRVSIQVIEKDPSYDANQLSR